MECPNGELVIEVHSAEEGVEIIKGADDYILSDDTGQCPTRYHVFGTFYSKNYSAGGCDTTAYWRTSSPAHQTEFESFQPELNGTTYGIFLKSGFFLRVYQISTSAYESNNVSRARNVAALKFRASNDTCLNITKPGYGNSVTFTKVAREDGLPDNCGVHTLLVSKNGELVLEKEYEEQPEITTYCSSDHCPPGSCECDCGDTVCCYHPKTGALIKSFTKE